METPPAGQHGPDQRFKLLYWVAAAAMAIALVLELLRDDRDMLKVGSRAALVAALVLLGTARPAETRGKKVLIYTLVAVALALLLVRLAR